MLIGKGYGIPYLYHVKFLATAATSARIVIIAAAPVVISVKRIAIVVATTTERVRHNISGRGTGPELRNQICGLCLLRSRELISLHLVAKLLNFTRIFAFLDLVETNVHRVDDVAGLTLSFVSDRRETAFLTDGHVVDCVLEGVGLLANRKAILTAAILNAACKIAVACLNSVDYTLCGEADLAGDAVDAATNVADSGVQGAEVTVELTGKLADCGVVALNGIHQEPGVLIGVHLLAEGLYLRIITVALAVPSIAEETLCEHHPDKVNERVVPLVVHAAIHQSGHCHRVLIVATHQRREYSGIAITATAALGIVEYVSFIHTLLN